MFKDMTESEVMLLVLAASTIFVAILALLVGIYALWAISAVIHRVSNPQAETSAEPIPHPLESAWKKWYDGLTDAVPIAREADITLHHDYDGIKELDNHLPPWWKGLFYVTIVFAVVYLGIYHVYNTSPLSEEEYETEVETSKKEVAAYMAKAANAMDETNVKVAKEPAAIASGKAVFESNCKVCHGAAGEGGVGPNLTDEYWLHGNTIADLFKTIKYGVPAKGMVSWQGKLKPVEIQQVSSYILSLAGTNPPNAKAPQGQKTGGGAAPAENAAPTDSASADTTKTLTTNNTPLNGAPETGATASAGSVKP